MKGLIEFVYLVAIAIGLLVIWKFYIALKLKVTKHKYQSAINVFHSYGYMYHSYYNYKGKGFIYRKQLDKTTIDSLLLRYGYEPLELNTQFKVFDYIAIMEYPEWEEWLYNNVFYHGGLFLVHFYLLEVQFGNKVYQRPFHYYLEYNAERFGRRIIGCAQTIDGLDLQNPELIETIISSDIKYLLQTFNDDEVRYWEHKLKTS